MAAKKFFNLLLISDLLVEEHGEDKKKLSDLFYHVGGVFWHDLYCTQWRRTF